MITFNEIFFNLITFNNCSLIMFNNCSLMCFCLKRMWNIFLPYSYCTTKFVYEVIPSIIVETTFLYLSHRLQVWQHEFSQAEEATCRKSIPWPYHFQKLKVWTFIFNEILFLRIRQIILSLLAAKNLDDEHKLALIFHTKSNYLYWY